MQNDGDDKLKRVVGTRDGKEKFERNGSEEDDKIGAKRRHRKFATRNGYEICG